ncbi:trehalase family glycosidase [Limibacter armeniacum]|uniref:trehalase family glycosidase n=1 Tax=Limibacter armeniacum TaxID=466084 RepID=UPI002FE573AE
MKKVLSVLQYTLLLVFLTCFQFTSYSQDKAPINFQESFDELFLAVYQEKIFDNPKTFVDCVPLDHPDKIMNKYHEHKSNGSFDLKAFVGENFDIPTTTQLEQQSVENRDIQQLQNQWSAINPISSTQPYTGTYIHLPHPYVVAKGGGKDFYYWDAYSIALGLHASNEVEMLRNIVKNCAWLIDQYGYVPEGNRTYYLGRTSPPFFSQMVNELVYAEDSWGVLEEFLPQLQAEYDFWMKGKESLTETQPTNNRTVLMPNGAILNRYYSENTQPRAEAYLHDTQLAERIHSVTNKPKAEICREIQSACESGWAFSSRWLADNHTLESLETTSIVPVDLNSMILQLEKLLGEAYWVAGDKDMARYYHKLAVLRAKTINKYLWDKHADCYSDYHILQNKPTRRFTIASMFPMYIGFATNMHSSHMAHHIKSLFMKHGGVATSLLNNGQTWDAPYGWAPMQWVTIVGLRNYQFDNIADEVKKRWVLFNLRAFQLNGTLPDKFNVEAFNTTIPSKYNHSRSAWTNALLLKLLVEDGK